MEEEQRTKDERRTTNDKRGEGRRWRVGRRLSDSLGRVGSLVLFSVGFFRRFKTESCVLVSALVAVLYAAVRSLTQSFKQRLRVQPWFSLLFLFFVSFFSFLFFAAFVCPFSPREIAWEKSKVRTGPHLQPVFREKNHAAKNGPTSKQKSGRREREAETETERELELTHRNTHKRSDTTLTSLTKCR